MLAKLKALDRNRLGIIGIALAIVLFLAVNILSGVLFTSARLDLTEDRLFTLSEGTDKVLSSIEEPIDLRFYYTSQLDELGPYFSGYARRVEELLGEYQLLSQGRLKVERLDPQPFSPEEDLAVAEGLEGLPLRADGTQAYFGLSGRNSTDDIEVIGYLAPERANFLEYDLTRLVHDLASPEKPVVAVLGDLPLMGSQFNQFQPWHVLQAMYQFFDVRFLGGKQDADRRGRPGPDARPAAQRRPGDALCDRPVRDARRPGAGVRRSARRGHGGGRRHEPDGQSRGRRDRRARAAARGVGRGDLERPGDRRSHRGATRERAGRGPPGGDRLSALAQPRFEPPRCRRRDHRRHPAGQSQLRRLDPRARRRHHRDRAARGDRASCRWRSTSRRSAPRPIRPS